MYGAIISLIINFISVIYFYSFFPKEMATYSVNLNPEMISSVAIISFIFWLLSGIGLVLYMNTKNRKFGILSIIGFAIFAPIGLIGALSVRNMMSRDAAKRCMENKENKGE